MSMDFDAFQNLCASRKSMRSFSDRELTGEQIAYITEIARTAPYASGKKNWELLVVTEREQIVRLADIVRQRSRELAEQVRDDYREMFQEYSGNFAAFAGAPALFLPLFRAQRSLSLMLDDTGGTIASWERDNHVKSIAGATMLIQLAATSIGLGSCCMTGPLLAEGEILRCLVIKRGFEIGAIIPVGYGVSTTG